MRIAKSLRQPSGPAATPAASPLFAPRPFAPAVTGRAKFPPDRVLQRVKLQADGTAIDEVWDEEAEAAIDTTDIDGFAAWAGRQSPAVLGKAHAALRGLRSPARHEAVARSRVKLLLAGQDRGRNAVNQLDRLPKDQWWRLFIDKGAQGPGDNAANALRFDMESSPGFFDAMTLGLETAVAPAQQGRRTPLTPRRLQELHGIVTTGTLNKEEDQFAPTRQSLSGSETTSFGMTKAGVVPSASGFEEMAEEGLIGLHEGARREAPIGDSDDPRMRFLKRATAATRGGPTTILRPLDISTVDTNYPQRDVDRLMAANLDRYYQEVANADRERDPRRQQQAKLEAIVRFLRALHVGHFFTDANGRLNTMLLLNQLLIEEGFGPVIMDDTSIFGGGYNIEQLIGQVKRGMTTFNQTVRNGPDHGAARRQYSGFAYYEDDRPLDHRVTLLHVIEIFPPRMSGERLVSVQRILGEYRDSAYSVTCTGRNITRLGFKKSMDALNLENELETFFARA